MLNTYAQFKAFRPLSRPGVQPFFMNEPFLKNIAKLLF